MKIEYRLLDFGNGEKLESLGDYMIIRPSPAAEASSPRSNWPTADAKFDNASHSWRIKRNPPSSLAVRCGTFVMPASLTPFGHLGVFPEQRKNWKWLGELNLSGTEAMNLFGYTGASTMAMSVAGASVTHVDAAKPNVEAARRSAAANQLQQHPIRYLLDDAAKFAGREVRRGRGYQTIVLDPPAFGHGKGSKTWRIERDLWSLLDDCLRLLIPGGRMLVTGHTEGIGHRELERYIKDKGRSIRREINWSKTDFRGGRLNIPSECGRSLDAGFFLRIQTTSATLGQ